MNGLCYDACFRRKAGRDRSRPITANDVAESQERLILDRVTHLDDLAKRLNEDRVRRVIEPILAGAGGHAWSDEDMAYVCDLGLVKLDADGSPRIANPIYREVVPRELTWAVQTGLPQRTAWFVDEEGGLDADGLIAAFQAFFREHSESWVQRFERYHEAGPQLLLQAHLQRVVNGGGLVDREYALGSGRTDLLLRWPQGGGERRFVVECKLLHKGSGVDHRGGPGADPPLHGPLRGGVGSPDRLRPFARSARWDEKIFRRDPAAGGAPITVWGM